MVFVDYQWSDDDEPWTRYRLKVVQSLKGYLRKRFTVFTMRNSSRFYMDGEGYALILTANTCSFLRLILGHAPIQRKPRESCWSTITVPVDTLVAGDAEPSRPAPSAFGLSVRLAQLASYVIAGIVQYHGNNSSSQLIG